MFNSEEEDFGDDRLVEALRKSRSAPLDEWLDGLTELVLSWSGRDKFEDDLSMLAIESHV